VSVLPAFLQPVAWALPPTYVFEGMRTLLIDHVFRADLMLEAFGLNLVFMAVAIAAFLKLVASARNQGSLLHAGE
jgi:ABC-2 type transport system permease protein